MKLLIAIILVSLSPISHSEEPERKRGEVTRIVARQSFQPKTRFSTIMVWDGKKEVAVKLPTNYLGKVIIGKVFPYSIKRDKRTALYVSSGRKGL